MHFGLAAAFHSCSNHSVPAATEMLRARRCWSSAQTDKDMTCEREMDLFFARNCYSQKEREKVKASPAYRLAMEQSDTIQAQEVAIQVLEGKLTNS
jgi:hypothetical protein